MSGGFPVTWDMEQLARVPRTWPAEEFSATGVRALFYEGLPWHGRETRVFAWYGEPPAHERKRGAMVLVHGGGGTAFDDWVRLWTSRGYAAIAMDTCGCTAGGEHANRPRHSYGGPPGWGGIDTADERPAEQWMYHAVADVILGHSLLRSLGGDGPIGLTGISWGGILACIACAIDWRLAFAASVYGCGFLGETHNWPDDGINNEVFVAWRRLWDPMHYLPRATLPMLWVTGTNDFAFPLPDVQRSYRLPQGPRTLCVRTDMTHGQEQGAAPREIGAFADSFCAGALPLPRTTLTRLEGGCACASFETRRPIVRAEMCYTTDSGAWANRRWSVVAAEADRGGNVAAPAPAGATVLYLNAIDAEGLVASSEHLQVGE